MGEKKNLWSFFFTQGALVDLQTLITESSSKQQGDKQGHTNLSASSNAIIPFLICGSYLSDGSYLSCCKPKR